jgi:two-component system sensor histidine kinase/response regulator
MTESAWRILIVDDDEVDRLAIRRALDATSVPMLIDEEPDPARVADRVRASAYDCLLIDHLLAPTTGLELVRSLRAAGVDAALLVISAHADEEVEAEMIAAGAHDYLPKGDLSPSRLLRRLRYAIRVTRAEAESANAIRQAREAAQARDEMLAIVSHDPRGPLSAIAIAADSLVDEDSRADRVRLAGAIRRGVDRAEKLIRDLLEVSRIEAGHLEVSPRPVEVALLLQQAVRDHELVTRDASVAITTSVADGTGAVLADRDRINQVLGNLISNSIKYAKSGGSIALSAEVQGDVVAISVADRGPGIAPESLPYLFDRFWQGRKQRRGSAGLGLAIAKGIVEAHGGSIGVASAPGEGARFTFTLPRAPAES